MKPLVISSNMLNESFQLEEWLRFVKVIADGGILVVDGGSDDNTQQILSDAGVVVIEDNIIQREGYGPARNHLRDETRKQFPEAHWMMYLDADERLLEEDFHKLRWIKDNLIVDFDVVGLPRIDWLNAEMTEAAKDWRVQPDWQARMSRLHTRVRYVRKLHEQVADYKGVYTRLSSPKIHHFHRSAGKDKRDMVGKLCAKLHREDVTWGSTYPKHHKEDHFWDLYQKEGLNEKTANESKGE